jgi:hypothetical protein
MAPFRDNADATLAHFDEVELEELSAQNRPPLDEDEDQDAIGLTACFNCQTEHSSIVIASVHVFT